MGDEIAVMIQPLDEYYLCSTRRKMMEESSPEHACYEALLPHLLEIALQFFEAILQFLDVIEEFA